MFTSRVQIYDPENDSWTYGQPAPQKVISATAGVTSGILAPKRIYVCGVTEYIGIGTTLGQKVPPVINQIFDPETGNWTLGASPTINRLDMAIAVIGDKLYVLGGYTYESSGLHVLPTPSAITEEYTPIGYQPAKEPEAQMNPAFIAAIATGTLTTIAAICSIAYFKKHPRIRIAAEQYGGLRYSVF